MLAVAYLLYQRQSSTYIYAVTNSSRAAEDEINFLMHDGLFTEAKRTLPSQDGVLAHSSILSCPTCWQHGR